MQPLTREMFETLRSKSGRVALSSPEDYVESLEIIKAAGPKALQKAPNDVGIAA